jgi:predicted kinase
MAVLTVCIGLPGSGKTIYAKEKQATWSRGQLARVNRDDLRRSVFGTVYQPADPEFEDPERFEDSVTTLQHLMIMDLLQRGIDVICDDTNLYPEHVEALIQVARDCGAGWAVADFTHVPLVDCIDRDAARPPDQRVGRHRITAMWMEHIQPHLTPVTGVGSEED